MPTPSIKETISAHDEGEDLPRMGGEREAPKHWCDTCEGTGSVYQEHQAGCHVGGDFPFPDCDGKGYWVPRSAAPVATEQAQAVAGAVNMFWNDADPERSADSIHEVIEREWSDGLLQIGDVIEIQRATRLSNIKVEIVPDPKDEDGFDYEIMPSHLAASPEAAPAAMEEHHRIPGLGFMTDEDGGLVSLLFKDETAATQFMRDYGPSVDFDDMPPAATPAAQSAGLVDALPRGFLSDVLTAAGLVEHGRRCKPLAVRLADGVAEIRGAALAQPAPVQAEHRPYDEAVEAVRHGLNALPRFSFVLDGKGAIARAADRSGRWIDWQSAHELFDPVVVDSLLAKAAPVQEEVEVPRERIGGYLNYELRNAYGDVRFGGFDISAEQFNAIAEILERAPVQQDAPAPSMVGDAMTVIGYTSPGSLRRLIEKEDDSLIVDEESLEGRDVPVYAAISQVGDAKGGV